MIEDELADTIRIDNTLKLPYCPLCENGLLSSTIYHACTDDYGNRLDLTTCSMCSGIKYYQNLVRDCQFEPLLNCICDIGEE